MDKRFKFYAIKICGILIVIFLLQVLINGFTEVFVLNSLAFLQVWRFLSSVFLHGGVGHLAYNVFALGLFGSILERLVGAKRFLIIFLVTGILANILSVNFYNSSLGASGAIFGVIGALIFIRPGLPVWVFGMPMPIFLAGILWGAGDFLGAIAFFSGNPISNTGNIAHLSGMFFGLLLGAWYRERRIREKRVGITLNESGVRNWEDLYLK